MKVERDNSEASRDKQPTCTTLSVKVKNLLKRNAAALSLQHVAFGIIMGNLLSHVSNQQRYTTSHLNTQTSHYCMREITDLGIKWTNINPNMSVITVTKHNEVHGERDKKYPVTFSLHTLLFPRVPKS